MTKPYSRKYATYTEMIKAEHPAKYRARLKYRRKWLKAYRKHQMAIPKRRKILLAQGRAAQKKNNQTEHRKAYMRKYMRRYNRAHK